MSFSLQTLLGFVSQVQTPSFFRVWVATLTSPPNPCQGFVSFWSLACSSCRIKVIEFGYLLVLSSFPLVLLSFGRLVGKGGDPVARLVFSVPVTLCIGQGCGMASLCWFSICCHIQGQIWCTFGDLGSIWFGSLLSSPINFFGSPLFKR